MSIEIFVIGLLALWSAIGIFHIERNDQSKVIDNADGFSTFVYLFLLGPVVWFIALIIILSGLIRFIGNKVKTWVKLDRR